jgi:hypothetical protein
LVWPVATLSWRRVADGLKRAPNSVAGPHTAKPYSDFVPA